MRGKLPPSFVRLRSFFFFHSAAVHAARHGIIVPSVPLPPGTTRLFLRLTRDAGVQRPNVEGRVAAAMKTHTLQFRALGRTATAQPCLYYMTSVPRSDRTRGTG
ncbi:hypothetical protein NDU88_006208 [Pleurodeles waltl]|uniref:Secreted protein n=1 Tax=Pleurodeles waltl TaxID=8319 RepID=A0AAV7TE64_PLEWA|nr:hypothetical protein NDU88_006208 [Pleurodeles waltl]